MTLATPPAGLIVRDAVEEDIAALVGLLVHGSLEEGKESPFELAQYRKALHEIAGGRGALLAAELNSEVVGTCQLIVFRHFQARGGLCAEIESVHVQPDLRGIGIGRVLMEVAIGRARAFGCYRVQLTSNEVRADAHRFYTALGFSPSHRGFKMMLS